MISSTFTRWKRIPTVIISVIVISVIIIIFIVNNRSSSSSTTELSFDHIDLLSKFCNQRNFNDDKKQPQWVTDNKKSTRLLTESDQVGHMYGENNELKSSMKGDITMDENVWDGLHVKGAFYMIVRNEDLHKARESMRSIEDRFNSKLNNSYPYIFLNNQRFTPEFKKYIKMATTSKVYFGQIDLEAWSFPYWIDSNRAEHAMQRMLYFGIENAHSQYFHQANRYQAGLFVHHPLFDSVEYVWHVESGTTYTCEMFQNDPFQTMKTNNKKIGFSLTSKETSSTMFSLWPATLHFMRQYAHLILPPDSSIMPWLLSGDKEYNFCYMWSSFQVVDIAFLKSYEYQLYFHYLDLVGGFFYERWTNGPVRTIAAAMFLEKQDIHFFNDVGFDRDQVEHCCPYNNKLLEGCTCDYRYNNDYSKSSCTVDLLRYIDPTAIDDMVDFARAKYKQELEEKKKISPRT